MMLLNITVHHHRPSSIIFPVGTGTNVYLLSLLLLLYLVFLMLLFMLGIMVFGRWHGVNEIYTGTWARTRSGEPAVSSQVGPSGTADRRAPVPGR